MEDIKILAKLKALFNMTVEKGCTEAEAANAMEKAQKLMLEHNIEMASVKADGAEKEPQGIGKIEYFDHSGYMWPRQLLNVIANNTLCRVVYTPSRKMCSVFGTHTNVKAVMEMYYWLSSQLQAIALKDFNTYKKSGGREPMNTWKVAFFLGAIGAINKRMKKPMDDFKAGTGKELVIYNDKALAEAVSRVFPRLNHGSKQYVRGQDGFGYGKVAGNSVSLREPGRINGGGNLALGMG